MTEKKKAEEAKVVEREPAKNVIEALNRVMEDVAYVQKGKKNTFHNYKYAGEEDLLKVLRPALVEHGIVLIPSLVDEPVIDSHGNTHLVMKYSIAHVSGDVWPQVIKIPGCGNDRAKNGNVGDKGTYKALTGANKYLLFKLFQIATGDDPEVVSAHDKGEKEPVVEKAVVHVEPTQRALDFMDAVAKCASVEDLKAWAAIPAVKSDLKGMPDAQAALVREAYVTRQTELTQDLSGAV